MKKLTGCLLAILMMSILAGCYSTTCPQPVAARHVNLKGEG